MNFWSDPVLLLRHAITFPVKTHAQESNWKCQAVLVNMGISSLSLSETNQPNWQSFAFAKHCSPMFLAIHGVQVLFFFFFWVVGCGGLLKIVVLWAQKFACKQCRGCFNAGLCNVWPKKQVYVSWGIQVGFVRPWCRKQVTAIWKAIKKCSVPLIWDRSYACDNIRG